MSLSKAAHPIKRFLHATSSLACAALLITLALGAFPARAGNGSAPGTPAQNSPNPIILPPDAVDDSGPGFNTANFRTFITGNVSANDSDPNGLPIFVQSFDTTGLKGQASYLSPGSLDTGFGVHGIVTTTVEGSGLTWAPLVQQPDGKLIMVGNAIVPSDYASVLARYFQNGTPDPSFGDKGKAVTIIPNLATTLGAALQADGKIIISGTWINEFGLARYNANGSLDTTFGSSGLAHLGFGADNLVTTVGVGVQPGTSGKIVVGGSFYDSSITIGKIAVARFNPDGSLDTTFGSNGFVITQISPTSFDEANDMLIQPDGKIVMAGDTDANILLVRYNPDGSLDSGFGKDGLVTTNTNHLTVGPAISLMKDGRIALALETGADVRVARYNPDGSLDTSFGGTGLVTTFLTPCIGGSKPGLAVQADGKVVVAAACNPDSAPGANPTAFTILRYDADGNLDGSFGSGGITKTEFGGNNYYLAAPHSLVLQPDGRIIAFGDSVEGLTMVRYHQGGTFVYNPNGQFDNLLPGETAIDPFTYTLSNGVLTDTATVTITVTGGYEIYLPTAIK